MVDVERYFRPAEGGFVAEVACRELLRLKSLQ